MSSNVKICILYLETYLLARFENKNHSIQRPRAIFLVRCNGSVPGATPSAVPGGVPGAVPGGGLVLCLELAW